MNVHIEAKHMVAHGDITLVFRGVTVPLYLDHSMYISLREGGFGWNGILVFAQKRRSGNTHQATITETFAFCQSNVYHIACW